MLSWVKYTLAALVGVLVLGCDHQRETAPQANFAQPTVDTTFVIIDGKNDTIPSGEPRAVTGYLVPQDSVVRPSIVKAGPPVVTSFNKATKKINPHSITEIHWGPSIKLKPAFDTTLTFTTVTAQYPEPTEALPPRFKDDISMNIRFLDVDQGMASPYTYAVMEDSRGYLWFGTYEGLSRYDGRQLQHFNANNSPFKSQVISMLEDADGNLWFGTQGAGAVRYNGQKFDVIDERNGFQNTTIRTIYQDRNKRIWLGTDGSGAYCLDGAKLLSFNTSVGLCGNRVWSIDEDGLGQLWIATVDGGITRLSPELEAHTLNLDNGLPSAKVRALKVANDGSIYAGTHGGGLLRVVKDQLVVYNKASGLIADQVSALAALDNGTLWCGTPGSGAFEVEISNPENGAISIVEITEEDGLSNNRVSSICRDSGGNLWLSTEGGGMNRLVDNSFTHISSTGGLTNSYVYAIAQDKLGAIWLGTTGGGIFQFNGQEFRNYTTAQGLVHDNVYSLLVDRNNHLWIGTYGGGLSRFDGQTFTNFSTENGLSDNYVVCLSEDRFGNIWIGTRDGGVCNFDGSNFTHYTESQGLPFNTVRSLLCDAHGKVWIGDNKGILTCFDGAHFTHYTPREGLSVGGVLSILEAADGALWFGTGGGVSRYFNGVFSRITEANGLCNNIVWSIAQGGDGHIWLGTMKGLCRIDAPQSAGFSLNKLKITNYFKEDGLRSNDFAPNSALRDKAGKLWWGTGTVLTSLKPEKIEESTLGQPCFIEQIDIKLQPIDFRALADSNLLAMPDYSALAQQTHGAEFGPVAPYFNYPVTLSVPHQMSSVTFRFAACDWKAPHRIRFQYRLNENSWGPTTYENKAVYSNLPWGENTFEVRAQGANGVWGPPTKYQFTIQPPWWATWWAYAAYLIFTISVVGLIFRWRTAALLQRQRELQNTVDERTHDLVQEKIEVTRQKEQLEKQNHEILESIDYAKRLQEAVLPQREAIEAMFKESFLLYMPRDIVSGDFYWAEQRGSDKYFAVADCTGHGVPGAMLSIIGLNALHRALASLGIKEPKDFLTNLTQEIQTTFTSSSTTVRDGMDIALCRLSAGKKLSYSGANIPLWVVRNGELIEINPDRRPIGYFEFEKPFTQNELDLQSGDLIYLFSDGYTSQQGGQLGKKLMRGQFRKLIVELNKLSLDAQKQELVTHLSRWKGQYEQTDDICVLSIKI